MEKPIASSPDSATNNAYVVALKVMVLGSPTVGGSAGYFKNGMKYSTAHIMPANMRAFLMSLLPGSDFFEYANTRPSNAPVEAPSIAPATIDPCFCHIL